MVYVFEGKSLAELYPQILAKIFVEGTDAGPRGLETIEISGAAMELSDTSRKFISYAGRDMNPVFPIVELMWYLSGRDKPDMVVHYASKMSDYVNPFTGRFDGAYGKRWRKWAGTFDQIAAVLSTLKHDPYSRRAVMTTFNPLLDVNQTSLDIPCNVTFQFMLRHDSLDMFVYCRSQDAWFGLPNDLCEWQMLLDVFAGWLHVWPGKLVHFVGSLHLYKTEINKVKELLKASDDNMYSKNIIPCNMIADQNAFNNIAKTFYNIEVLSRTDTSYNIAAASSIPNEFWKNASLAVLAYNARKHNKQQIMTTAIQEMDHQSDLHYLIVNWFARRGEEVIHR